ncbi:leucyl/phenylalanyl-tRNA--protein transferase [Cereibacter azotoformans]|uniref:Leucyl/phenylalanyl-tRNA--protein transferase n=1 Tax=Cereibacter sphaeroides (strain ATCC 17025 / ATH 2.4.3) TaxID=349102 RepID=LFTR_CERS5|nr:leucyl/phenylalanyl-tRNA--protein transferase [Cereibacter azotoformans]A4WSI3.1 RecName: Full=Leucyl/phenylalanyl-tRNA--protein transferase; AltName: Full=L/F-transferase; AltName: Full=Leucyltransferase; AltName: Full=Phenyalanyltransferase [Cereibacter sphaeroides ATCC 17025]ULB09647.1 leucyl/phenylalanyl-tRNA--protein transferase [Cereibacter azotoformans]
MTPPALTPRLLLRAYALGIFPMAESRDDPEIHWVDPRRRGIFPLDGFHISRSLARRIRRMDWTVTVNEDFAGTVRACADRDDTWINPTIFRLYVGLHALGHAHSLEVREGDALVGGVYGVTLGRAFFGESMFSRRTDASKVALAFLIDRLRAGGFTLFDTQFLTPHLASLGAIEIPRADYHRRLGEALAGKAEFAPPGYSPDPASVVQRSSQTS